MGRPTKLTPKVQATICDALRKGVGRETAGRLANIGAQTLRTWLTLGATEESGPHRDLLLAVEAAEDSLHKQASDVLLRSLSSEDPKIALQASKFILERRFPETWATRREVAVIGKRGADPVQHEVSGPNGGPIPVQPLLSDEALGSLSDKQLETAIAALASVLTAPPSATKPRGRS